MESGVRRHVREVFDDRGRQRRERDPVLLAARLPGADFAVPAGPFEAHADVALADLTILRLELSGQRRPTVVASTSDDRRTSAKSRIAVVWARLPLAGVSRLSGRP